VCRRKEGKKSDDKGPGDDEPRLEIRDRRQEPRDCLEEDRDGALISRLGVLPYVVDEVGG
jgi:hypothetical protein